MTQPSLDFHVPLTHTDDPDTSRDAVPTDRQLSMTRRRVLDFVRDRGTLGATYCEVESCLDLFSARQRLSDLARARPPFVVDSGERRPSPRGRDCVVWIVRRCR